MRKANPPPQQNFFQVSLAQIVAMANDSSQEGWGSWEHVRHDQSKCFMTHPTSTHQGPVWKEGGIKTRQFIVSILKQKEANIC